MLGIVGLWKDRAGMGDAEAFVRNLRDDDRLERLEESDRLAAE
jgi:hypothetical protein